MIKANELRIGELALLEKPISNMILANEYRDKLRRSSCSNIVKRSEPVPCMTEEEAKVFRERFKIKL